MEFSWVQILGAPYQLIVSESDPREELIINPVEDEPPTPARAMDRHRMEKQRRKAPRSVIRSVWLPAFGAIFVLYMVLVVKVNYYATSTTANGVGGAESFRGAAQPVPPKREMQEGGAPKPAMMQAATNAAAPLRPEMKRPTLPPDLRVGAITKAPPSTSEVPVPPTTQPVTKPVTTAPPPQTEPLTKALTGVPPSTKAPEETVPAAIAPVDRVIVETAQPLVAPVVKDLTQAPEALAAAPPIPVTQAITAPPALVRNDRHEKLHGYRQAMSYLDTYQAAPGESLFLYFACSDDQFNAFEWSDECKIASKRVYDVFAKSPLTNRLVTIYAGSENYWNYQNKFRNDPDLRVKTVPSIMKWHGNGGETSGMMITDSLEDEPLVRYLFKNKDQPDQFLNAAAMAETKTIETVKSYEAFQAKLAEYKAESKPRRPLYLLFVSGRISTNNRPWCPYCRYSELPLEYGFYAFAPPKARLLRVEVTPTYAEWKTPNKFNRDPALGPLRGVPAFFTVQELASKELKMERIYERFDRVASLKDLFDLVARVHDE
jgi:hypothetical protein